MDEKVLKVSAVLLACARASRHEAAELRAHGKTLDAKRKELEARVAEALAKGCPEFCIGSETQKMLIGTLELLSHKHGERLAKHIGATRSLIGQIQPTYPCP